MSMAQAMHRDPLEPGGLQRGLQDAGPERARVQMRVRLDDAPLARSVLANAAPFCPVPRNGAAAVLAPTLPQPVGGRCAMAVLPSRLVRLREAEGLRIGEYGRSVARPEFPVAGE